MASETAAATCATCRQPLTGRYCSRCGEEALDPRALTVRHFVGHTLVHETLHVDGKLWRTLRSLLFRPGFLTLEYCAGRRRLYVNPVRLLIIAIIVYAVATRGGLLVSLQIYTVTLSVAPTKVPEGASVAETIGRIDRFGLLGNLLSRKAASTDLTSEAVRDRFHQQLERFAEPLSFTNVLLLAVALYALFHGKRPLLVEHGVFSMHLVSFVLLSSLTLVPGLWILQRNQAIGLAVLLMVMAWQFAYLAVAVRRFYFGGEPRALRAGVLATAAAILVYVLNSAFITGVQLVGGALALRSI